jgi:hypothetical protein
MKAGHFFPTSSTRQIELQDVEETLDGSPKLPCGTLRERKGVAKDRRISIQDEDMRHGRKSRSQKVDGYKRHILHALLPVRHPYISHIKAPTIGLRHSGQAENLSNYHYSPPMDALHTPKRDCGRKGGSDARVRATPTHSGNLRMARGLIIRAKRYGYIKIITSSTDIRKDRNDKGDRH